jgi:hypothetical protein
MERSIVSSSAVLAGSACDYPNDFVCAEVTKGNAQLSCKEGTVVDKCKAEGRFATCLIKAQSAEVSVRFYTGYTTDAKADCEQAKGSYKAD